MLRRIRRPIFISSFLTRNETSQMVDLLFLPKRRYVAFRGLTNQWAQPPAHSSFVDECRRPFDLFVFAFEWDIYSSACFSFLWKSCTCDISQSNHWLFFFTVLILWGVICLSRIRKASLYDNINFVNCWVALYCCFRKESGRSVERRLSKPQVSSPLCTRLSEGGNTRQASKEREQMGCYDRTWRQAVPSQTNCNWLLIDSFCTYES